MYFSDSITTLKWSALILTDGADTSVANLRKSEGEVMGAGSEAEAIDRSTPVHLKGKPARSKTSYMDVRT